MDGPPRPPGVLGPTAGRAGWIDISMMRHRHMTFLPVIFFFIFLPFAARAEATPPGGAAAQDFVLLVDNSGTMEGLDTTIILSFVDTLGESQRLAVVKVGEESSLSLPLSPVTTAGEKKAAGEALRGFDFMDDFADVRSGLDLALAELEKRSSDRASKLVILVSDGRIDEPAGWIKRDAYMKELREGVLSEYFLYGISFYAVAVGEADLPFMQEIASAGAGRCLSAPNGAALGDALAIIGNLADMLQPAGSGGPASPDSRVGDAGPGGLAGPTVPEGLVGPVKSSLPTAFWIFAVLLLAANLAVLGFFAAILRRQRRAAAARDAKAEALEAPTMAQMRSRIEKLSALVADAASNLENFQVDLVTYGAERWERERSSLERYCGLAQHLFLMLDHLEIQAKEAGGADGASRLYGKACRILEEEGIKEIAVKKGDPFDGKLHKHVGQKPDGCPAGAVIEVARKGYVMKAGLAGEGEFVLRPAEVIVSAGPEKL